VSITDKQSWEVNGIRYQVLGVRQQIRKGAIAPPRCVEP
jgi:hypothetical protein